MVFLTKYSGCAFRSNRIPSARFSQTATGTDGYFSFIWRGSSPIVRADDVGVDSTNPFVLRRYPRDSTPTRQCSENRSINSSATGVFPVPPTVRFPIQTTGISNSSLRRIFRSNSLCLIWTTIPYSHDSGTEISGGNFITHTYPIFKNKLKRLDIKVFNKQLSPGKFPGDNLFYRLYRLRHRYPVGRQRLNTVLV